MGELEPLLHQGIDLLEPPHIHFLSFSQIRKWLLQDCLIELTIVRGPLVSAVFSLVVIRGVINLVVISVGVKVVSVFVR